MVSASNDIPRLDASKMAPSRAVPSRLQIPSTSMDEAYYSSTTLNTTSSEEFNAGILSPRTLYAQSFDRPNSSQSLPSGRRPSYKKNMSAFAGFGTTEQEFDTLPLAVRRKYFSTLERLRLAECSRANALNELPIQRNRKPTLAERRGSEISPILEHSRNGISSRKLRKFTRSNSARSVSSSEVSRFLTLPEKIKKNQFTREEQVILAGRLRESVILDAADEAIYKASRRASRNLTNLLPLDSPISTIPEASTIKSEQEEGPCVRSSMDQSIYETFRWMDEEQDLDLKLVLDDYHANLDGVVIPGPESSRRPSFRRTMSITKMPFGRNSISSLGPRSPTFEPSHTRQKSKAMSMMVPRHTTHASISSIDPNATHYQDPEARLKLRVYLASPQKFDEAIEFGFPSIDGVTTEDKENRPPRTSRDIKGKSHSTETGQSFLLNDVDIDSLFEDDTSMFEPESPLTPADQEYRSHHRTSTAFRSKGSKTSTDFSHLGINKPMLVKQPETYAQAMAGNREMTLRMTLTRPDLRADETAIYGWQTSHKSALQEPLAVQELNDKEMRGPFGGSDGWGPEEKENGVVKRFWNKVKSGRERKNSMTPLKSG
ncbi:hypothetical protein B0O99DRAFT_630823 [Bisporella sp. PMI_857]|nr:hypothetical protein B0O99DRAFT_630823 [Bisporella sp. PMI_857]